MHGNALPCLLNSPLMRQAAHVTHGDHIGAALLQIQALAPAHSRADFGVLDREKPAETAAFVMPDQVNQFGVLDIRQSVAAVRRCPSAQQMTTHGR